MNNRKHSRCRNMEIEKVWHHTNLIRKEEGGGSASNVSNRSIKFLIQFQTPK